MKDQARVLEVLVAVRILRTEEGEIELKGFKNVIHDTYERIYSDF